MECLADVREDDGRSECKNKAIGFEGIGPHCEAGNEDAHGSARFSAMNKPGINPYNCCLNSRKGSGMNRLATGLVLTFDRFSWAFFCKPPLSLEELVEMIVGLAFHSHMSRDRFRSNWHGWIHR